MLVLCVVGSLRHIFKIMLFGAGPFDESNSLAVIEIKDHTQVVISYEINETSLWPVS